jgi:hypothetical protein
MMMMMMIIIVDDDDDDEEITTDDACLMMKSVTLDSTRPPIDAAPKVLHTLSWNRSSSIFRIFM